MIYFLLAEVKVYKGQKSFFFNCQDYMETVCDWIEKFSTGHVCYG